MDSAGLDNDRDPFESIRLRQEVRFVDIFAALRGMR
jgi:hypothetical protein